MEIKSTRVGWAGHVTHMGNITNAYKIFIGTSLGRRPLRNLGVGLVILLKSMLQKWNMKM